MYGMKSDKSNTAKHSKCTVRRMAFNNDIAPLWHNGPTPGAFYHFPGNQCGTGGFQKSQYVLFDYKLQFLSYIFVYHNLYLAFTKFAYHLSYEANR